MIFWEIKTVCLTSSWPIISPIYPLKINIMCFLHLTNERISRLPFLTLWKVSSRKPLTPKPEHSTKVKWKAEQWSRLLEKYTDRNYRSWRPEFHQDQNFLGISVCRYFPESSRRVIHTPEEHAPPPHPSKYIRISKRGKRLKMKVDFMMQFYIWQRK